MTNFTLSDNGCDDVIDSRDIVERIEELEAQKESHTEDESTAPWTELDEAELVTLTGFVDEIEQYAGDKASDGITCVEQSHFTDYVQTLLEDCGEIPANLPHYIVIDWAQTAENVKVDYTPCDLDGVTFWIR